MVSEQFPLLQVPVWIDLLAIGAGALAGAAGAVRKRFDLIGVLLVAIMMGLGGGIIRDVLLGLRPVAVTSGYFSGCAVAAWGFFLRAFTPKNERIKSCADVLIYSNLLMIAVNVFAMNRSPFIGLSLSMLCLVIGIAFIWMLPLGQENTASTHDDCHGEFVNNTGTSSTPKDSYMGGEKVEIDLKITATTSSNICYHLGASLGARISYVNDDDPFVGYDTS